MGDKIENIDDKSNNELIEFTKQKMYENMMIELQIEQLKRDIEYNKEVIDECKDEIDERIFEGRMENNIYKAGNEKDE